MADNTGEPFTNSWMDGFFRVKNPKVISYSPGFTTVIWILSFRHTKLLGCVLTVCTFHGTPWPDTVLPVFHSHLPTWWVPHRDAYTHTPISQAIIHSHADVQSA